MIAILGAFGRTGRSVTAKLQASGDIPVRLVTRSPARRSKAGSSEVAVARLSDEDELRSALRGARALFALLPDDFTAQNFHAERRATAEVIARAITAERVARVVLLSASTAAFGEHGANGMGADLAYLERLVCSTGASVTVLRASYFQDNLVPAAPIAERFGVYHCCASSPDQRFPTVAAAEVGAIAARTLLTPAGTRHEVVDVVGPAYSWADLSNHLGAALGKRLGLVQVPAADREPLFRQWMSPEAARAMVETLECIGSARATPRGSRVERAHTRVDEVLRAELGSRSAAPEVLS